MERDDICLTCRVREALQHAQAIDLALRRKLAHNYETIHQLTYSHRHSLVGFFPQAVAATEVGLQRPWKQEDAPS